MPTIRYQIRNEYGLGSSELYGAADKDDPEAILEGVAMSGLLGLLRQLGDLAEFAAEVFHNLHEEVINTAYRGHKLMLRGQQLESELPSIQKGFFPEGVSSCLSYREGIDWHCYLQMGHNLITAGDMPHFIMDTYKKCRGPPQLFKLDKFDIAGAGACLKRYSDPSFFRMELTSSRLVEQDVQREKIACKIKNKVSFSYNGESPESFLMPHMHCRLQPATLDQVFDTATLKHVKLKPRRLKESVIHSLRSYMTNPIDMHSTEQQVISETSVSQSIAMKSADLSKSDTKVHEIVVDASSNREKNQSPSPTKQEMTNAIDLDKQKIERKCFSDTKFEPASEVGKVHPIYSMLEEKATVSKNTNKTEGHSYGSQPSEVDLNLSAAEEMDQNGFLPDAECRSENISDNYVSDEISSELDNYMDALTTMESEIETDAENRGKPDTVFVSIKSPETDDSDTEEQEELQAQYSEQYFTESSALSPGFNTIFRKGAANPSFSDTIGHLAARLLEENKNDSNFHSNSDVGLGETNCTSFEQTYDEQVKSESSDQLLLSGTCNVKASDIPTSTVCGEAFCSSSTTETTSTIPLVNVGMNKISSSERKTDQVVSYLDGQLPCKRDISEFPSGEKSNMIHGELAKTSGILSDSLYHMTDQNLLIKDNIPKEIDSDKYIKEQSAHDTVSTTNRPMLHSQKQHETALEKVTTGTEISLTSSMNDMKFQESSKQDKGSSFLVKPVFLDPEMGNVITSNDGLASSGSVLTLKNADTSTERKTPISNIPPCKKESFCGADESQRSCTREKVFRDDVHFLSDKVKDDVTQGSRHRMVLPHKSTTASGTLKDVDQIESCYSNTSSHNVISHIYIDNCDQSICSPDVYIFNSDLQQKMVADGAYSGKKICRITGKSCSENAIQLDYTSFEQACASPSDQALSSLPSLVPEDLLDIESSSGLKPPQNSSPENSKEMVPDVVLVKAVETFEDAFRKESSGEPESVSVLQDGQRLKPSALLFFEDSSAIQGSTGIYPTELVDKKILVKSSESQYLFNSKASILYPSKSSNDHMILADPSGLSEDASELQVGIISSAENELLDDTCNSQEPGAHLLIDDADFSKFNMPPPKETISGRLSCEGSIPFQCNSDLHENSSSPISASASLTLSIKEKIPDTITQQSSEQRPELPSSSPLPENNDTPEDTKEISQIAQLPPIPWRLTKPPLGSLVSSRSVAQPPSGSNLATSLSMVENDPSHMLLVAGVEIANSDCTVQSQKSRDTPVTVKESYENDTLHADRKIMGPALESLLEEDKDVYDHNAFGEGIMKPTELPSTVEYKSSQDISVSPSDATHRSTLSEVIPSADEISQDLELKISQNGAANLDRKSPTPFLMASAKEDEKHKYNQEVPSSAVNTKLPPLPMTKPEQSVHASLSTENKSSSSAHDLTTPTPENEKPTRKLHSVIIRPNDPLIEAIASHDKSKLRKAPELIRSSAMPMTDERGSFLEQIRNKSFSLKPTAARTMRFKGGPPTNLKVIAILEKANAIRQACAGSDDDDDGDSWSDS